MTDTVKPRKIPCVSELPLVLMGPEPGKYHNTLLGDTPFKTIFEPPPNVNPCATWKKKLSFGPPEMVRVDPPCKFTCETAITFRPPVPVMVVECVIAPTFCVGMSEATRLASAIAALWICAVDSTIVFAMALPPDN